MKFSIGYNFDIALLDLLTTYRGHIEALYFPIPDKYLGSGRDSYQPSSYPDDIHKLIDVCNSLNIRTQLLINATCGGKKGLEKKFFSKLLNYTKQLQNAGLTSVVTTNMIYVEEFKDEIPGIEVESSVNCYVKTVEHALYLKDLGVDILTIDRDINRNIALIKQIKDKTDLKIRIMLNEGCLRNCPFREMHYNYVSHGGSNINKLIDSKFGDTFCARVFSKSPEKVLSIPFIPPDALAYYVDVVDYYKLTTRTFPLIKLEACLKAYIDQAFDGNLLELLDCPGVKYGFHSIDYAILKQNDFFDRMVHCDGECDECGYCQTLMQEAVVINSDFFLRGCPETMDKRFITGVGKKALEIARDGTPLQSKPRELFRVVKRQLKR
jgi:hypothetical protein